MTKSASQHKAAPRKTTPQQPETQSSQKNGSGRSQPSKGQSGKGKPGKSQPVVKQRGTALTVVLILVSLGAIIDAIIPLLYRRDAYEITHPYVLGGVIIVGLLGVVGAIGLWLWKRWGLYLFVASVVGSIAVGLVLYPVMAAAFHAMIPLMVLGYGLSRDNKLALFE
jgi:hypothetical protein